jgi:hypothetical protein
MVVTLRMPEVYGTTTVKAMLVVVRAIQALFLLAGIACGIGSVVVVGGLLGDTRPCVITEENKPSPECGLMAKVQVQGTVGVAYALASGAMMIGAVALNGIARPGGSTPAARPGPFTQQASGPFAPPPQHAPGPPPQQPPLHPGQPQPPY